MKNDTEYNRQKNIIDAINDPMFIHYLRGYLGTTKMGECAMEFMRFKKQFKKDLTTSSKKV